LISKREFLSLSGIYGLIEGDPITVSVILLKRW